jgi:hypothetical protein
LSDKPGKVGAVPRQIPHCPELPLAERFNLAMKRSRTYARPGEM